MNLLKNEVLFYGKDYLPFFLNEICLHYYVYSSEIMRAKNKVHIRCIGTWMTREM